MRERVFIVLYAFCHRQRANDCWNNWMIFFSALFARLSCDISCCVFVFFRLFFFSSYGTQKQFKPAYLYSVVEHRIINWISSKHWPITLCLCVCTFVYFDFGQPNVYQENPLSFGLDAYKKYFYYKRERERESSSRTTKEREREKETEINNNVSINIYSIHFCLLKWKSGWAKGKKSKFHCYSV